MRIELVRLLRVIEAIFYTRTRNSFPAIRLICFIILIPHGSSAQEDCVFNDDYEGLTKDWIERSSTSYEFEWIEEANTALCFMNSKERIELQMGGCIHFNTSLIYRSDRSIDDREFWLSKALELSQMFDLQLFVEPLEKEKLGEPHWSAEYLIFPIPDEELSNRITDGIVVKKGAHLNSLILEYYVN